METFTPFYAYKETRLDLDPTVQGSTVVIRLPGANTFTSRAGQKRPHVADIPIAEDENAFRQRHLATASSIYHRKHKKSIRSFLWRVLEDGKVLSIRSVDISRQSAAADANLALRLVFPSAIKPGCIAFSDSKEHDILSTFVITESKQIYTLSLRPEYFRKPSSTEDNVDWCKLYSCSTFTFKQPHRLVALDSDELLVSLSDGGLIKFDRHSGGDGSTWQETHYSEGGWRNTVRSVVPFQAGNTVRYNDHNLELSTVTSIASPVISIDDLPYAFTVSLDHKIRVWNLRNRKIAYMSDILDQELDPHEQAKRVVDPFQSQLVRVFANNGENALCVTFSPLGSGQFKFWNVTPAVDGTLIFVDLFPGNVLEPQAPSSEIWTLADFAVVIDKSQINSFGLWVLWKNNVTYRLHRLDFQSGSVAAIGSAWKDNWMAMATETLRDTLLPTMLSADSADGTDKWLEFILSPGRFTQATIETGLAIYGRGLGASKDLSRRTASPADRMCTIIASTTSLSRSSDGNMDFEQFRSGTDAQWRRFYRLLLELDKQRGEAMSLVIDYQGEMPWVVLADGITAIRSCSDLERIWHNNGMVPSGTETLARPLFAAAAFRDSLSEQFIHSCRARLAEETFQEPSLTDPMRMRAFYEKCNFSTQIGDEDYSQLVGGLGGTFKDVTPKVYEAMLSLMDVSSSSTKGDPILPLAEFGKKLIVKGVQEIVELHRNICLDQFILLIFIEAEINHGEEGIQFETAAVFRQLMLMLQRLELIEWLTSTQIFKEVKSRNERSNSITDSTSTISKKGAPVTEMITVLEGVMRHLFGLDLRNDQSMPSIVTDVIVQICAVNSVYEAPPAVIQCFLLVENRPDLALEFSRFTGADSFSTYVRGRAYLAANDAITASTYFKKAALGMAYPNKSAEHRSAGYLDDVERGLLNSGLPEYYSHIVALYEKEKLYSFVIDFARLSLQFIKPETAEVRHPQIRTDMHSRLFNAAIQTTRYEIAHSILALFTDNALQQSSLRTLVTKMCESSYALELIELPFIGLQDKVDDILAQKCQGIVDVNVGIPYHKILYAWRIKRGDFRGAAATSFERLQRLQQSGGGDRIIGDDELETPITKQYIALINALSCVDPKQAWILSEDDGRKSSGAGLTSKNAPPKRKVVTLDDVRKSYQAELDRIAAIQNDQFAFVGGDEMDVL
ncbi:uncharacterized protein LY89DRAFT_682039 [Mollisia scopiformis]|uniref:Uncharacterized protein n=1 Tax=Mollisia scopiformis TaxID=149040 RepID=A0A194XKG5_MOLSC|nr:uncharacterized protein LY89DRAFT_682039 [Mollisia scopiformis]KUJ20282.1 hypothetical protein LY89DRAFT_682039 [Mollisia scopiformis]